MITSLTLEQEQKLSEYRDKWLKIGLSTQPVDHAWAQKFITQNLYPSILHRQGPKTVLLMPDPLRAWLAVCLLATGQVNSQIRSQVDSQVESQVESQVDSQVELQIRSQVDSQVASQIYSQVELQIRSQVDSQVESQVESQVDSQVDSQVELQIRSQVDSQVDSQVASQIYSQVASQIYSQVELQIRSQVYSQVDSQVRSQVAVYRSPYLVSWWWAGLYGYYDYMVNVLGVRLNNKVLSLLGLMFEIISNTCHIWPLNDYCILSDRPDEIRMLGGVLHCDGGPAISYRSGLKVFSLHGVAVPEWLAVMRDTAIDPSEFAKITNVEVRREFVRKVGVDRIVHKIGAKTLDKQGDVYELLLVDLKGRTGEWPYLKMKNPSIGVWHLECVDRSCRTVEQALNWRNQTNIKPEVLT